MALLGNDVESIRRWSGFEAALGRAVHAMSETWKREVELSEDKASLPPMVEYERGLSAYGAVVFAEELGADLADGELRAAVENEVYIAWLSACE